MVDRATLFRLKDLACQLSKRQQALVEAHVLDPLRSIDEIGQTVGYKPGGGAAALTKPKVRVYVDALLQSTRAEERLTKELQPTLMGVNEALGRLAMIARASVSDHLAKDETGRLSAAIDLDNSYAIKELKLHEYVDMAGGLHTETTFKMEDKKPALEMILRAHGVFQDEGRSKRYDEARDRLWRAYLAEHPEEIKKLHLKLLAIDTDPYSSQIIELPPASVSVPSNGSGAPA